MIVALRLGFGTTTTGGNQQRKTVLHSGKLTDWSSAIESENCAKIASAEIRQLARELKAACTMASRKLTAARAARSAVTGPCRTEYGPCITGKKKIMRTHITVTTAISHPWRPETIAAIVSHYDAGWPSIRAPEWQDRYTKVNVPPGLLNPSACNNLHATCSSPAMESFRGGQGPDPEKTGHRSAWLVQPPEQTGRT